MSPVDSTIPRAVAAFLAVLLVLIPLPGHWRARNIATLSIIGWLVILNIVRGVNTILWADNVHVKLVIWCDIVSKLAIGANMALPAACFCLAMRLEGVAAVRHVKTAHSDKRRRTLVDLAICVGLPIMIMTVHYVVQGHRFDIVQTVGCQPTSYVSVPEFFLLWFVPILLCLGTFILGGLAFMHFFRRRATFARHLAASNTGLTPSRYFRLMAMSLLLVIWLVVVFSLTLSYNYRNGLRPWTNWDDVHSNWLNINRFPYILIPAEARMWLAFIWWTIPVTAYIFFAFFAFSRDAAADYASCLKWFRRRILRQDPNRRAAASTGSSGNLNSPKSPKMDQLNSFASSAYTESETATSPSPLTPSFPPSINWRMPSLPLHSYFATEADMHYATDEKDPYKAEHIDSHRPVTAADPAPPYVQDTRRSIEIDMYPASPSSASSFISQTSSVDVNPPSPTTLSPPPRALAAQDARPPARFAHSDQMV